MDKQNVFHCGLLIVLSLMIGFYVSMAHNVQKKCESNGGVYVRQAIGYGCLSLQR